MSEAIGGNDGADVEQRVRVRHSAEIDLPERTALAEVLTREGGVVTSIDGPEKSFFNTSAFARRCGGVGNKKSRRALL